METQYLSTETGPKYSLTYNYMYRKTSNISRTLVGNKIVDNSDVVGASPVGTAPTTSSFSTKHLASMDWAKITVRWYKKHLKLWDLVRLILEVLRYVGLSPWARVTCNTIEHVTLTAINGTIIMAPYI